MKSLKNILISYVAALVALVALEFSYYRFMPITHFIKYESVHLVGHARFGYPLTFISNSFSRAGVTLVWRDLLFCQLPGDYEAEFILISYQPFERVVSKTADIGHSRKPWQYHAETGPVGSTCFLEYGPTLKLKYGIRRQVEAARTETFLIGQ